MLDSFAGCRSQLSHRGLIVILSSSSDPEDLEHVLCEGYAPGLQGTFDAAQAPTAHPSRRRTPAGPAPAAAPRHRMRPRVRAVRAATGVLLVHVSIDNTGTPAVL